MRAALADRDALYAENIDLKARLGRSESEERILAGVIMRPPATPYDTIVIDAGFEEGVARGDFVSAGGTTMVGSVSELYAHASRVTLISSPGEKYEGLLHLRSGETLAVAVEGQGGGSLFAQVPSGTQVHVGDSVVLPGVAGGLIARVRQVEAGESDSFSTIYLSLPVSVSSLYFVEVLKRTSHVAQ
jgi:cell shape-determining protein MreC